MSKQLRRFLASLLVISLLVTGLSFAALSEAAPTEPVETQVVATAEEPAVEVTETSTEEPAVEATEAPMEEPEAESTEAPAEESAAEATEAPSEDGNESSEISGELSDVQKEALESLPVTFSTETVAEVTSCAHENTYSEEVVLKGSDYNGKYGWYDEDEGTFDGIYYNDKYDEYDVKISRVTTYCSDCKEKLKETLKYDRSDSYIFFHAFDEDNGYKCRNCGFVCPHTETSVQEVSENYDYEYVAVNEKEHQYTVTYTELVTVCEMCGEDISTEKINKTETVVEEHICYDGVCDACGYVYDACKHEDILRAGADDGGWTIIDENYHLCDMTFNWSEKYDYCRDCGCSLKDGKVVENPGDDKAGEERYVTDFSPDPHTFVNGVCKYCGYQKQEEDEQKPYVRGFTMSQTTAKVGDTVKFTLELANVKDGEALELQFIADGQLIETFSLTAPQNTFEHEFSKAGNRKLQFRVTGGECCPEQTLKVETNAPKVETVSLSLGTGKNFTITEKAEGEKITAKIACNGNTSVAELYVGESYAFSEEYVEENGKRIFTLKITLGGNNACYADKYEMRANALKQRYVFDDMDKKSIGTLTVKHDYMTTETSSADKFWKKSTAGHERYEKVTTNKICKGCANETKETTERVIVNLTAHSYNADGVCEVCGWGENRLSSATVLNKHVEDSSDYYYGNDFILFKKGASVQAGYIRFVSQIPGYTGTGKLEPAAFDKTQWQWGKIDRSGEAAGLCSYAALSMQLSYLGIDCTPGKMFKILNPNESSNFEYGFNRKTIIEYLNDTENASIDSEMKRLVDKNLSKENLDAMLSKYETDFNCSPIFMFMEYGEKWKRTHAVLIIGREGNTYYIANPETRTGMGSFEIEVKDDGIMYITNASTAKYNGRRISLIAQTCKTK